MTKGTITINKLIHQHPNTPNINPVIMLVRLLYHLRGKIIQSAAICLSLFMDFLNKVGPPKIREFQIIVFVDENILRFYIPVNNIMKMNVF